MNTPAKTMNTPANAVDNLLNAVEPVIVDLSGSSADRTHSNSSAAGHAAADALGIIKEWGAVGDLTATRCVCCGQKLTDAVSVTRGMGPVCSKEHYDVRFEITDLMVAEALGILFASNLESPVKAAARTLKDKPRDLCNVLVWWAAAHLDQTDTVLDCAEIMSTLGFESLGSRIRERNTNVIISLVPDDSGDFRVRCRSIKSVRSHMSRIVYKGDASVLPREGRFKFGWEVKASHKDLVWVILGEAFGGEWATVPGGTANASKVVKMDATTWYGVRAAFETFYPRPNMRSAAPPQTVVRTGSKGTFEVHTPSRNYGFISELKAIHYRDRKWNPQLRCWIVTDQHLDRVRALVAKHFNGAV